jgi:hypothetical protein
MSGIVARSTGQGKRLATAQTLIYGFFQAFFRVTSMISRKIAGFSALIG